MKTTSAQKKARETLDVYAPLANRLGMNAIKTELEELSFKVLYPKIYNEIVVLVARRAGQRDVYLKQILAEINEDLDEQNIKAYVTGRPKDYFSIYQKMIVRGHDSRTSTIWSVCASSSTPFRTAMRRLVPCMRGGTRFPADSRTTSPCRSSTCTSRCTPRWWAPVASRSKSRFALGTCTAAPNSHRRALEIQGKRPGGRALSSPDKSDRKRDENNQELSEVDNLKWIQQLADWTSETPDSNEFLGSLKEDLGSSEVYVFTPKGKIVSLPAHATPVDFAYAVHTEVGHRTMGARVNGRLVPLDTTLDNGDTVEILTSKSDTAGPSRDWLSFVKSRRPATRFVSGSPRSVVLKPSRRAATS